MAHDIVAVVLVLGFAVLVALLYATFKSKNVARPADELSQAKSVTDTYLEPLKKSQELERATKDFFDTYRKVANANEVTKKDIDELLNEWELFSLQEILNARTSEQLSIASKLAITGSIAEKFIQIQKERISALEVDIAGNSIEKLLSAVRMAPKGGQAELIAFSKLQRLLSNKQ